MGYLHSGDEVPTRQGRGFYKVKKRCQDRGGNWFYILVKGRLRVGKGVQVGGRGTWTST